MFKKLFGRGASKSDLPAGSFHRLGWVQADESPYGVLCLDCRSYTRAQPANSEGPKEAGRFLRLRRKDGTELSGRSPENALRIACELSYPRLEKGDGPLFRATVMEDKWDAFQFGEDWYLAESWTGRLVFKAHFEIDADGRKADSVEYAGALKDENDAGDPYRIAQADFLIKLLIYGWKGPHPLPPGSPDNPKDIAELSFGLYGRQASFATFEDTTALRPDPDER